MAKKLRITNVYLVVCLGILYVMMILFTFNYNEINPDVSIYVDLAERLLDGQQPYIDYIEINPPLIHYLSIPPVIISRIFSLELIRSFNIFMLFLIMYSTLTVLYVLRRGLGRESEFFSICMVSLIVLFTMWQYRNYGQREHLFLLLSMPFYLLRWQRYEGTTYPIGISIIVGMLGGIGLLIKPFFIMLFALPELYWLIRFRKLRLIFQPETIGAISMGVAYLLYFLLNPAVADAYFNEITPALLNSYSQSRVVPTQLLYTVPCFLAIIVSLFYKAVRTDAIWSLLLPTALTGICGLLIIYLQGKGWDYHQLPFWFFSLLVIVIFHARQTTATENQLENRVKYIALPFFIIYGIFAFHAVVLSYNDYSDDKFVQFLQAETDIDDSILIIQYAMTPAYPSILAANRTNANSYTTALPLMFDLKDFASFEDLYNAPESEQIPPSVAKYQEMITNDIETHHPEIFAVLNHPDLAVLTHDYLMFTGLIPDEVLPRYQFKVRRGTGYFYEFIGDQPTIDATDDFYFEDVFVLENVQISNTQDDMEACATLNVTTWWDNLKEIVNHSDIYSLSIVLTNPTTGQPIASVDEAISRRETADLWRNTRKFVDSHDLTIPCDTEPGSYSLILLVYNTTTLDTEGSLDVRNASGGLGDVLFLTTVNVK